MQIITCISQIDEETPEGQMLMVALTRLVTNEKEPTVRLLLQELGEKVKEVYVGTRNEKTNDTN